MTGALVLLTKMLLSNSHGDPSIFTTGPRLLRNEHFLNIVREVQG